MNSQIAAASVNGLYKGGFAAVNKEKNNLLQGQSETEVLYSAPISPTLESFYVFYLVIGTALLIVVPPFVKKGQDFINNLLGLKRSPDEGISLTNQEALQQAMQVIEKFNEKRITAGQAQVLLTQFTLLRKEEISRLLNTLFGEPISFHGKTVNP